MKTLIAIAAVLLAGCALQDTSEYRPGRTGVMGPDGHTIIWDPPAYAGPSGEQVAEGIAQGISDFARGYAQGASEYQPQPSQWHSGAIFGPNGQTSLYNLGPNGGAVFGPNGQTTIISGN